MQFIFKLLKLQILYFFVRIVTSFDIINKNGKFWPVSLALESGPSAYSDLSGLPDGSIICLYEGNKTIRLAKFSLEWLTKSPQKKTGN